MAAYINTNISSLNAQRNLASSQSSLQTALQRLSSGLRVNSAKDDAAGLAIADRMNSQIRGNTVAIRNANDGISLAQTAEGALGKVGDALQRMRELAVQANNATNSDDDRDALDKEFGELSKEIQRVLGGTSFNGTKILAGGAGSLSFQVGANTSSDDSITITTTNLQTDGTITAVAGTDNTGAGRAVIDHTAVVGGVSTIGGTGGTIDKIDAALKTVNTQRAVMGASQNRFESVIGSLQVSVESQSAARSRIMDTDFAEETANLTRGQILQQAGTAMLAQANSLPNTVLTLLRG
jgi:flagellin